MQKKKGGGGMRDIQYIKETILLVGPVVKYDEDV